MPTTPIHQLLARTARLKPGPIRSRFNWFSSENVGDTLMKDIENSIVSNASYTALSEAYPTEKELCRELARSSRAT